MQPKNITEARAIYKQMSTCDHRIDECTGVCTRCWCTRNAIDAQRAYQGN